MPLFALPERMLFLTLSVAVSLATGCSGSASEGLVNDSSAREAITATSEGFGDAAPPHPQVDEGVVSEPPSFTQTEDMAVADAGAGETSATGNPHPHGDAAPPQQATGAGEPYFDSLEAMVAAARAVVVAEVVATEPGLWLGEEPARLRLQAVTLRIDEVLSGSLDGPTPVTVHELGWNEREAPIVVDGVTPSVDGTRGIFFLSPAEGNPDTAGDYVWLGPQAQYHRGEGDALTPGRDNADPLANQLAARGYERLRHDIVAAARPTE